MTRSTLAAANATEAAKSVARVCEMAELVFPGGTIHCTTASVDVPWNGKLFKANARLVDSGAVGESSDLKARRIAVRLSGLDSALVERILTDEYQFSEVNIWLGFFDETWRLVWEPHEIAPDLLMSGISIALDTGSGEIELSAEYFDIFAQRDSAALATPASQRLRYSTDTGMDKVARIMTQEIFWGGRYAHAGGRDPFRHDRDIK